MATSLSDDASLPLLREDLRITRGAPFISGAPGWVIHDPVRHRFYQIGQRTVEILSSWSMGSITKLKTHLLEERSVLLSDTELGNLMRFLAANNLLEGGEKGTARNFSEAVGKQRGSWFGKTSRDFLFFRVPLLRPNNLLYATWPFVSPLFSRGFLFLTLLVLIVGLYLAGRQLSALQDYVRASFSWAGIATYFLAIVMVKIFHELGHAYQAVSRGLRVPVMGIAFFVMLPLLYTDISDAWRLRSRRERIMIDLGGVMVELTIAVYSTLLWCFLPDGPLRAVVFAVATSSWTLSLLINLNPLMRFDGYFLLSDMLGMHNLQQRSFEMAKWNLRSALFGLKDPPPEPVMSGMRRFMSAYAVAIWIYRFFLFLGISLLVYTFAFKALGAILFAVTITRLIIHPVVREIAVWNRMRSSIVQSPRTWITLALSVALLAAAFWPTSIRIYLPAVLQETRQQMLYPPVASRLERVFVVDRDIVQKGDPLFQFSDPELPLELLQSRIRIQMFKQRLSSIAGDERERAESLVTSRLLKEEEETLSALMDRETDLLLRAEMNGVAREIIPEFAPGTWVGRHQLLGRIIDSGQFTIRGFVNELDRNRLDLQKTGVFVADDLSVPTISLRPMEISDFSVKVLPDAYLASSHGGQITVAPSNQTELVAQGVWYPATATPAKDEKLPEKLAETTYRGVITMRSKPISFARRVWRRVALVLVREQSL